MSKNQKPCGHRVELKSCPNVGVPYLVGDSTSKRKRIISKARCKMWNCEFCMHVNKSQHVDRIAKAIARFEYERIPLMFVTLTCHENWRGHENSIKNWSKNRDKLFARYRREVKKQGLMRGDYVYLPECHQDGTIHIHGIFAGRIETRWWKDNSRECGLGYMAESAKLDNALQAINYITKYITKEMGKASVRKGFRRINYSRTFPATETSSIYDRWRKLEGNESIKDGILEGLVNNYDVEFDKKSWSFDDFLD